MCTGLLLNSEESDGTFVTTGGNDDEQEFESKTNKEEVRDKNIDNREPERSAGPVGNPLGGFPKVQQSQRLCGENRASAGVPADQDEYGGSWYDDFEDDSGLEEMDNVSLEDRKGEVGLSEYDRYTKLLLHMNGPDSSDKFPDSSASTHTVTAYGDAQIDTSEKKLGGASAKFDGDGDYLSVPDSEDWNFGSGDFTIDFWAKWSTLSHHQSLVAQVEGADDYWRIVLNYANQKIFADFYSGGVCKGDYITRSSTGILEDTWYHLAFVRRGNIFNISVDGVSQNLTVKTPIDSNDVGDVATNLTIGREPMTPTEDFSGWLDEFRISKGIARWTSNFDPPNKEYYIPGPDPEVKLLLHMNGPEDSTTFRDSSFANHPVTYQGNANITTSENKFGGGSGRFDGNGDYLSVPDSDDWNFGNGDFTIDFWVRYYATPPDCFTVNQWEAGTTNVWFIVTQDNIVRATFSIGGVTKGSYSAPFIPSANTWYHIAFVRNGTTGYFFINGTNPGTTELTAFSTNDVGDIATTLDIGARVALTDLYLNGWLDELRITKGTARWTSNFTPPNQEHHFSGPDTNTKLLLHMEGPHGTTDFYDNSISQHTVTPNGGVQMDDDPKKMGKTSAYFGGDGDYLTVPDSEDWNFGNGDFTIDFWVRLNHTDRTFGFIGQYDWSGVNKQSWYIFYSGVDELQFRYTTDGTTKIEKIYSWVPMAQVWYHIAVVRNEDDLFVFINGSQIGITEDMSGITLYDSADSVHIGTESDAQSHIFYGYMDELRITKGLARWTSDFTSPNAEYRIPGPDEETKLMLHMDGDDGSTSFRDSSLGNHKVSNEENYDQYTKLMLHMDDEGLPQDSSGKNNHASSNTATLANSGKFEKCLEFDGIGDEITVPDSDDWHFGDGDFTIECYIRYNIVSDLSFFEQIVNDEHSFEFQASNTHSYLSFSVINANVLKASYMHYWTPSKNNWYHIALARDGGNMYLFLDGVQVSWSSIDKPINSSTNFADLSADVKICKYGGFSGFMDEFRISKGIARWITNFTLPSSPYGQVAKVSSQKKFGTTSAEFHGSGEYLSVADSDDWNFGDGDFTIDFWVRFNSFTSQSYFSLFMQNNELGNPGEIEFRLKNENKHIEILAYDDVDSKRVLGYFAGLTLNTSTWYHFAFVRNGSTIYFFQDGVSIPLDVGTAIGTTALPDCTTSVFIGSYGGTATYLNGWLDELRISKGIARWTGNFSPPNKEYRWYSTSGSIVSPPINLSENMRWNSLTLNKTEPSRCLINVSVINTTDNTVISGFGNLTESNIDLSDLNTLDITSIRLKAWFRGDNSNTPTLHSWGVEWVAENAWRDSFVDDNRSQPGLSFQGGQVQLAVNNLEPEQGCVGYWSFDEGGGQVVEDSSGNGNEGTLMNMDESAWVEGVNGEALEFDGVDDYVNITNGHGTFSGISVEAWVKLGRLKGTDNGQTIFDSTNHKLLLWAEWGWTTGNPSRVLVTTDSNSKGVNSNSLSPGIWYHLTFTWSSFTDNLVIYQDGIEINSISVSGNYIPSAPDLFIGRHFGGHYLKGIIDEVAIYDRALNASEILAHSQRYSHNSTLRSENISLPINKTWSTFHFNRSVPDDTFLNVTVHDADTDEILFYDNRTSKGTIDLSTLNSFEHPTIYLQAQFQSNRSQTPILYDWAVSWENVLAPELAEPINMIFIMEDTPQESVLDLNDHFYDKYSDIKPSIYDIEYVFEPEKITLQINVSLLDIVNITDNWTGGVEVKLSCTNLYNQTTLSNLFIISVMGENDGPVWLTKLPTIEIQEDHENITQWSLRDYVYDAEHNETDFKILAVPRIINVTITGDNKLHIIPFDNFSGNINISVRVFEVAQPSLYSDANVSINITPVNDAPVVRLLHPVNNTVKNDVNVTFEWLAFDAEDDPITFDLHLGKSDSPGLHTQMITSDNITVDGLEDGETYYWYVKPHDGFLSGNCLDGIWNFTIDVNVVIPYVRLLLPLDGNITNKTEVNLTWEPLKWSGRSLTFHVYQGFSDNKLEKIGTTNNTWYLMEDLYDNTTYYWMVIPVAGTLQGKCLSGIWQFTVNTSFEPVYTISWSIDKSPLTVKKGQILTFNLTINNTGNNANTINVGVSGVLSGKIYFNTSRLLLLPGISNIIMVKVLTSGLEVGPHTLLLELTHMGGQEKIERLIDITEEASSEPPTTPQEENYFLLILLGIVLIILFVGIIIIMKRRKREETPEIIEPEEPSQQSLPTQFAPSVKHEYTPKTDRAVPSAFPASPQSPEEESPSLDKLKHPAESDVGEGTARVDPILPKVEIPAPVLPTSPQSTEEEIPSLDKLKHPAESDVGEGTARVDPILSQVKIPGPLPPPSPAPPIPQTASVQVASPIPSGPQILGVDIEFAISDIFLISIDGRLIKSVSFETQLREEMDEDIMSSMLTAITDFIQDSFKADTGALKTLQHGKMTIYIERGVGMYLAVVFQGPPPYNLREKMRWLLIRLWEKYKKRLKAWDGSYDGLDGMDTMLSTLMKQTEPMVREPSIEPSPSLEKQGIGPTISIATEAVMCNICMGVIKPGLEITTCTCGNKYHKACGERIGVCPRCNASLIMPATSPQPMEDKPPEEPPAPVENVLLGAGAIPESETKVLPEFSGQKSGEKYEFRILD